MKKKRYSLTMLLTGKTQDSNFTWMDYPEAFERAGESLRKYPEAWGMLIHSDHNTGIILTRKHFSHLKLKTP